MQNILSVVIVEYHSINEIMQCVASFATHIKMPYEIIVSSNSCYDQQQQAAIDQTNANVRWLFNSRNGGFAYAMNEGLKVARGDYLVIMNSDCTLVSDIDNMIRFMDEHPEVGAIAPQMKDSRIRHAPMSRCHDTSCDRLNALSAIRPVYSTTTWITTECRPSTG